MRSLQRLYLHRASWFAGALILIALVGDGWSGRPVGIAHQLLLLPFTAAFCVLVAALLFNHSKIIGSNFWTIRRAIGLAVVLELVSGLLFLYESRHFRAFGYSLHPRAIAAVVLLSCVCLLLAARRGSAHPAGMLAAALLSFTSGRVLSILSFPLNYLRSDMLPVIAAADQRLLQHGNPYATLFLGTRPYAFPYLPGMIVAYLPVVALHVDPRFGSLLYLLAAAALIYWAARPECRTDVALLLTLFLLSPFLQYRHELYLQPHWLTLVLAFVLMQRCRFALAAFVFGISMAVYQFSWILFPFVLLHALRRRGWPETLKLAVLGALGALAMVGPFLHTGTHPIANNTVAQWGHRSHALADPMNLSYWATFLIPPHRLLLLQAALMIAIFGYCFFRGRCADLADALRWMSLALIIFVLMNVVVDGYFFLMILVVLLVYTCVANGWWADPQRSQAPASNAATSASPPAPAVAR